SIQPKPAKGEIDADLTSWLREMLQARGAPRDVIVSQKSSNDPPMLSIPLDEGWITAEITDLPPQAGRIN
ncbi:hypothetical protein, partial [Acinetobacter baumannii]|uniref:hypothetical protein n=1 Tax=Acinetobacter baumannii TaxID=470 RepID=UPI001C084F0D